MGVVRTDRWLKHYEKQWLQEKTLHMKREIQRDFLIKPLSPLVGIEEEELHRYFHHLGLCRPEELTFDLSLWGKHRHLQVAQEHFLYLKKKWNGSNVKIYILPIDKRNKLMKQLGGRTGITFSNAIILFIDCSLSEQNLRALLTHEYSHHCRLLYTNEKEETMTLLESIIMEGIAEYAVKEELGARANAIWTKMYDEVWDPSWFNRWIKPNLQVTGRKNHYPLLYGSSRLGIPLWLGYYTGYKIVCSAMKTKKTTSELLQTDAQSIYEASTYFKNES